MSDTARRTLEAIAFALTAVVAIALLVIAGLNEPRAETAADGRASRTDAASLR